MFDADAVQILKAPNRIITVDEHQVLIQLQMFSSSQVSGCKMISNRLTFSRVFPPHSELFPGRSTSRRASRARKPRCSPSSWVRRAALSPPQMCWRQFRRAETSHLLSNTSLTTAPSARSRCPSVRSENTAPFLLHIWSESSSPVQISLSPALTHLIRFNRLIKFQNIEWFCSFAAQIMIEHLSWRSALMKPQQSLMPDVHFDRARPWDKSLHTRRTLKLEIGSF